ncbi:S-adenosyl-L-methionine-dependent methyltransferase [Polyplosphaeria fusca]|uniref:S-adenosyl-L-methionine-dependent methyltransferase n=1 Tax=Polyplosphaeria fusca TaxID=682080 RepID=A0A9P4QS09_9PLEO|nr:S-adenosyl-L-methionine-dependent methyltransferase [Polyplosphaeria fusca]
MAQPTQSTNYIQGYSQNTTSTHQLRTAESDAAFLLPHVKTTDHILDVGCGPGTITTGFAAYATSGTIIGIDISPAVLQKAQSLAAAANVPTQGPGSVVFEQGDVLGRLPYADETFDIVYASQVFGHLVPSPELPLKALAEIRRVLKPNGILATRDGAEQHFYPKHLDLDRLWVGNFGRAVRKGKDDDGSAPGINMLGLMRGAGFDVDGGKVRMGAGASLCVGKEARRWLADRGKGQLREGDRFRESWVEAGISEEEIQETVRAVEEWAEMEDAWYVSLQAEVLAWK